MSAKAALVLSILLACSAAGAAPASVAKGVTYSPPEMSSIGTAELRHYYQWREKMDWLNAPIHTRADLDRYLEAHKKSASPLDALSPDARKRLLSQVHFGPHGAFVSYYGDLQYLSTQQVYRILALFGEQNEALVFTGGKIRAASPQANPRAGKPSPLAQHFSTYEKAQQSSPRETSAERAQRVTRDYARWFAPHQTPESVRTIGSHDLRLLFRAACIVTTYTHESKYARDAEMDFREMYRRRFAGPPDYEQMYKALIHTRQFAAARKFQKSYPDADLTPLPAYRDEAEKVAGTTPTVLVVSTAKRELIRRTVNLDKPAQVLILTDPHCHFCARFDHALQAHPELQTALAGHTLWVTSPGSEFEFDTLQQWNKAHAKAPLAIMYDRNAWPMVKNLAIPQFFFLRHGKVVKHHMGWGKNAMVQIRSDLEAIGLLQ